MFPQTLNEFYTIEDNTPIGQGAYAKVVKGRDNKTGQIVAIKIYQKQKMDQQEEIALERQVHIMRQINHPNIVDFYGSYSDKKHIYLVLEYLSGGQLYDHIVQKQQFCEKEAKQIMMPIVDALRYLHQSGIVHRDIKPENIVYSSKQPNKVLKIIDFGVSQIISTETHLMSTAIGTPMYMAPEILYGHKYNETIDWWSVGVILYMLLCGYPPFYADSQEDLQKIIMKGNIQFDPEDWDPVSNDAKDLITKLLQINPKQRFGIQQILQHSWIVNDVQSNQQLDVPQKLKKFKHRVQKLINVMRAVQVMQKGKLQSKDLFKKVKKQINEQEYQ